VAFTWLARNFKQDCRIVSYITVSIPKLPLEPPLQDTAVDIVTELRTEQENVLQLPSPGGKYSNVQPILNNTT
jgi:hypothetical protein